MRSTIIFTIMVFYAFICIAQTGNPFDIGLAKEVTPQNNAQSSPFDTSSILSQESKANPISNNPFDIIREVPALKAQSQNITDDAKAPVSTIIASNGPSEIVTLIYVIVVLCLLTFAISLNRSRFFSILKSLFNSNFLKNLYKENRAWTNLQSIVLYGLFVTNAAYLMYLLNHHYFKAVLPNVFILVFIVLAVYLIRHITMAYISSVYRLGQEVQLHNFSIGIHNMVLGIILIPFIMGFGFVSGGIAGSVAFILYVSILIFYALRQLKGGLSIIISRDFNVFYFFIYLCGVEIAPILVTWKVVSGAL